VNYVSGPASAGWKSRSRRVCAHLPHPAVSPAPQAGCAERPTELFAAFRALHPSRWPNGTATGRLQRCMIAN